jgi:putative phosphoesterase
MIVGLISDTHGLVRPEIARVFADVGLIIHAGDVGGPTVLEALSRIAPVEAVFGNVDDPHDPALARERTVTVEGRTIHVSHGHELGRPTPELALARYRADVVVFGHTHRPVTYITPAGRIAVNPGAAGPRRFDLRPTVARLVVRGLTPDEPQTSCQTSDPIQVEVISLA